MVCVTLSKVGKALLLGHVSRFPSIHQLGAQGCFSIIRPSLSTWEVEVAGVVKQKQPCQFQLQSNKEPAMLAKRKENKIDRPGQERQADPTFEASETQ